MCNARPQTHAGAHPGARGTVRRSVCGVTHAPTHTPAPATPPTPTSLPSPYATRHRPSGLVRTPVARSATPPMSPVDAFGGNVHDS